MTERNFPLLLLVLLIIFCFTAIFFTPFWGDEKEFHYPNVVNLSPDQILDKDSDYSSTYPPLPYIFGAAVYKLNSSIYSLRILNFLVFLLLIYFIYKISVQLSNEPFLFLLLIVSNPYILKGSFIYYMTDYGLLAGIAGIYFYFFSNRQFLAHFFFGLAVLCQQWMLIMFFSVLITEFISVYKGGLEKKVFLKNLAYKFVFLLPSLFLFYMWGGLTHPNFSYHKLLPTFVHLTGSLANFGIFGIFLAAFSFKKYIKIEHLFLILFIPVLYLSVPAHSEKQKADTMTGAASQFSTQLEHYIHLPYEAGMVVLAAAGLLLMVMMIYKQENPFLSFLKFSLTGFLIAFSSSEKLGATHVFISMPFLFMLFHSELKENKIMRYAMLAFFYLMSFFYVIYFCLYKTRGFNL